MNSNDKFNFTFGPTNIPAPFSQDYKGFTVPYSDTNVPFVYDLSKNVIDYYDNGNYKNSEDICDFLGEPLKYCQP